MYFNSLEFIFVFLPVSFGMYFWLTHKRLVVAARAWLVFVSLFFYSWWNISYLPLILFSILVNYSIGVSLGRGFVGQPADNRKGGRLSKKSILTLGVVFNLGLLGYFKYADFFIENINILGGEISLLNVALPLAISFFTFQQIAYLVDSYREETREYDLLTYILFVTFFPQLIAGPIVHHKEMIPQFVAPRSLVRNYYNIALGLFVFSVGLFKKVVVADSFGGWADPGFDGDSSVLLFHEAWVTSLSYTFQLYFDFSGYTDMAIGAAFLFNIKLPINFNSPYKALDIQDFWRRWHITLSRFLKDYLYIPLGGNRRGELRTYINLFVTFLIGGLWHGASWMFVIWGAMHGFALVVHRAWTRVGRRLPAVWAWLITFNFINLAWVFFRAKDMDSAMRILKGMAGLNGFVLPEAVRDLALVDSLGIATANWLRGALGGGYFNVYAALVITMAGVLLVRNSNLYHCGASRGQVVEPKGAFAHAALFLASLFFVVVTEDVKFLYFDF